MDGSHHMAASVTTTVTELNLSVCHPSTIVDKINAVPGLKTSTAFFTFLRANLVLQPSAMSSNVSTPILEPTTSQTLAPPSPSPLASRPPRTAEQDDDIPPLSLDVLTTNEDKVDALHLVADSIAQQRQQASLALVFSPAGLALLTAGLAVVYRYAWVARQADWGLAVTLGSGVVMSYLLGIRYLASPYIQLAEALQWSWLTSDENGEEDVVIGTRYGSDMVGALVLRLEPGPAAPAPSKRKGRHHGGGHGSGSLRGGRGVIRAWTTKLRYRGKGLGQDMLHEAVRVTRERCGRDAEVGFAREHANSTMVLPEMFNGRFRKREIRAAKALETVLADWDGNKRKR